jgi:voltage-gated potassium channel Kch
MSGEGPRVAPVLRPITRKTINPRRAAGIIAGFTIFFAVAGAFLAWALDRKDFPTIGNALWWSLQTVTTVGYGDIVPANTEGRIIGGLIMLTGIAFVAVVTAAVTAALVETARQQLRPSETQARLEDISRRLAAIEAALEIADAEPRD